MEQTGGCSLVDASYGSNEHAARPKGIIQWNNTKVTCEVVYLCTILIHWKRFSLSRAGRIDSKRCSKVPTDISILLEFVHFLVFDILRNLCTYFIKLEMA